MGFIKKSPSQYRICDTNQIYGGLGLIFFSKKRHGTEALLIPFPNELLKCTGWPICPPITLVGLIQTQNFGGKTAGEGTS